MRRWDRELLEGKGKEKGREGEKRMEERENIGRLSLI
jgi:hypothetical protein